MRTSGRRMRTDAEMIKTRALNSLVIVVRNADEDPKIRPTFEIEHEPGIFDRLFGQPGTLPDEHEFYRSPTPIPAPDLDPVPYLDGRQRSAPKQSVPRKGIFRRLRDFFDL